MHHARKPQRNTHAHYNASHTRTTTHHIRALQRTTHAHYNASHTCTTTHHIHALQRTTHAHYNASRTRTTMHHPRALQRITRAHSRRTCVYPGYIHIGISLYNLPGGYITNTITLLPWRRPLMISDLPISLRVDNSWFIYEQSLPWFYTCVTLNHGTRDMCTCACTIMSARVCVCVCMCVRAWARVWIKVSVCMLYMDILIIW
jgi:hypothetical protein